MSAPQFQILAIAADMECCLAALQQLDFEEASAQLLAAKDKMDALALEVREFTEQPQPKQLTIDIPNHE